MLHETIQRRIQELEPQVQSIQQELSTLPEGHFTSSKNQNHTKWYTITESGRQYLPKSNRELATLLAQRKYLELQLKEIQAELRALRLYIKTVPSPSRALALLANTSYKDLLGPYLQLGDHSLQQWQNAPFPANPSHPENLIHATPMGYSVRSKSEVLIAITLQKYGIPHRYECPLPLTSRTIYPDFTLLHPRKHNIIYWEHLGMMDNPTYAQNAGKKIQAYISDGIYPGIQLILTSETSSSPLSLEQIECIIRDHFL